MPPPEEELSPEEAFRFLQNLFPDGLKNPALTNELCPEGWVRSPFYLAFHPTPDQRYQEHIQMQKKLNRFKRIGAEKRGREFIPEPTPSFEGFQKSREVRKSSPSKSPTDELAELIGLCLWDIFSDNHDVIHSDGRLVSLGSFRGAGGTIGDFVEELTWAPNSDLWERGYDYIRYYMGTSFIGQRTSFVPIYEMIFYRLKKLGCNWRYSFPRLHLFTFTKPATPETDYSPSEAFQQQQIAADKAHKENKLRKELDHSALEEKREARRQPPPETVGAYQNVFECFPTGWPPDPYDPS